MHVLFYHGFFIQLQPQILEICCKVILYYYINIEKKNIIDRALSKKLFDRGQNLFSLKYKIGHFPNEPIGV